MKRHYLQSLVLISALFHVQQYSYEWGRITKDGEPSWLPVSVYKTGLYFGMKAQRAFTTAETVCSPGSIGVMFPTFADASLIRFARL